MNFGDDLEGLTTFVVSIGPKPASLTLDLQVAPRPMKVGTCVRWSGPGRGGLQESRGV